MPAENASRRSHPLSPLASADRTRSSRGPRRRRVRIPPPKSDVVDKKVYPAEPDLLKREEIRTRSFIADLFEGKQPTREEIMGMWPEIKRKTGWKIDPCPINAIREWVEEGREALQKDTNPRATAEPRGRAPAYYPWEETRAREIPASRDSSTDTIQPDRIRQRCKVFFGNSNANSNVSSNAIVDEEASAKLYTGQGEAVSDIVGIFVDRR